jgi:hypothetical protein
MKFKVPTQPIYEGNKIKVQLDSKTVIIIKSMESFKMWKQRYPNAKIIK